MDIPILYISTSPNLLLPNGTIHYMTVHSVNTYVQTAVNVCLDLSYGLCTSLSLTKNTPPLLSVP